MAFLFWCPKSKAFCTHLLWSSLRSVIFARRPVPGRVSRKRAGAVLGTCMVSPGYQQMPGKSHGLRQQRKLTTLMLSFCMEGRMQIPATFQFPKSVWVVRARSAAGAADGPGRALHICHCRT